VIFPATKEGLLDPTAMASVANTVEDCYADPKDDAPEEKFHARDFTLNLGGFATKKC
jgi:hypothetical protein